MLDWPLSVSISSSIGKDIYSNSGCWAACHRGNCHMDWVLHGSTRGMAGTGGKPRAEQRGRHTPSHGTVKIHRPGRQRRRSQRRRAAAEAEQSTEPISSPAAQGWGQCSLDRVCLDPSAEPSPSSASTNGRGTDDLPTGLLQSTPAKAKRGQGWSLLQGSLEKEKLGQSVPPCADMQVQRRSPPSVC